MRLIESEPQHLFLPFTVLEQRSVEECITNFTFSEKLIGASPAQFILLWRPGFVARQFMIAASNRLELFVKSKGPFTEQLTSSNGTKESKLISPLLGQGFTMPLSQNSESAIIIDCLTSFSSLRFLAKVFSESSYLKFQIFIFFISKEYLYFLVDFEQGRKKINLSSRFVHKSIYCLWNGLVWTL